MVAINKTFLESGERYQALTRRYWVEKYDGTGNPSREWGYVESNFHLEELNKDFVNNANIAAWGFTNELDLHDVPEID